MFFHENLDCNMAGNFHCCRWRIMQLASLRLVSQGTRSMVSCLVIKKPVDLPLATCPPPHSTEYHPSKCESQGRTTGPTIPPLPGSPPAKLLSRLPDCVWHKERGGWCGTPRAQTPPSRPHVLLVVIASKAVVISSFLSGIPANGSQHKFPLSERNTTEIFQLCFVSTETALSFSQVFLKGETNLSLFPYLPTSTLAL